MKSKHLFFLIITAITLFYGYLVIYLLPPNSFFTMDNGVKFIQAQGLILNNFKNIHLPYPGKYLDPSFNFFPIRPPWKTLEPHIHLKDNQAYSMHPFIFPFLSSYFYKIFGFYGLFFIPIISSFFSLILIYLLVNKIVPQYSLFSILLTGLGSPLFFYSLIFWEHTLSIFITTLIFYLLCLNKGPSKIAYFFIGLLIGLNSWIRMETTILSISMIIILYLLQSRKDGSLQKVVFATAGFVLSLIPLLLYNYWLYGSVISAHNKYVISDVVSIQGGSGFLQLLFEKLTIAYHLWFNGAADRINNLALIILTIGIFFLRLTDHKKTLIFFLILFLLNSCYIGYQNFTHPATFITGLIPTIPYVVFILFGLPELTKNKEALDLKLLLYSSLSYLFLTSIIAGSDGGNQWGPRYFLPALPALIIFSLYSLSLVKRSSFFPKIYQGIFLGLCLISFFIQWIGFGLLQKGNQAQFLQLRALEDIKSPIVVSYSYGLSTENATLFYKKCFFWVDDQGSLKKLLSIFVKNKIKDFCFVSFDQEALKKDKYASLRWDFKRLIEEKGYQLINHFSVSSWYVYNEFKLVK